MTRKRRINANDQKGKKVLFSAKYELRFFERYRQPLYYFDYKKFPIEAIARKERFFLIVRDKETQKKYIIIYHIKRDLETNKVLRVDRFLRCVRCDKWILTRKYYMQTGNNYQEKIL